MTVEDGAKKTDSQCNSSILELIYKDANESVKFLRDDVNSINTRLTLLIGFNATFVTLLSRLPNQTVIKINIQEVVKTTDLYPQASELIEQILNFVNWCLILRPLVTLFLIISSTLAIWSVLPSPLQVVIFPRKMLEKSKNCSEEAFKRAIILNRNETVERLQKLIDRKAWKLKCALLMLGAASVLLAIDIVSNIR